MVFAGCGAIVINSIAGGAITHVGIGLTFGLVVMAMIYATGHLSGAHFNPAVTLAFAAIGEFAWRDVLAYVVTQVVAAIAACACLLTLFGDVQHLGATLPSGAPSQSLVMEVILTFFLMYVITSVATDARAVGVLAGVAIGGTVALEAIFAGPVCGASMNPARSIGPALVSGELEHLWLYLLGPFFGAPLGAWTYRLTARPSLIRSEAVEAPPAAVEAAPIESPSKSAQESLG